MNEDQTETAGPAPEVPDTELDALRREAEEHRDRPCGSPRSSTTSASAVPGRSTRRANLVQSASPRPSFPCATAWRLGRQRPKRRVNRHCSTGCERRYDSWTRRSSAHGIREINPAGEPFDPNKHEALSLLPAPGVAPNTVIEVVQKGYELNERLLRAAKVIVARAEG